MSNLFTRIDIRVDGISVPTIERRTPPSAVLFPGIVGASAMFDYQADTDTAVSTVDIAAGMVLAVDRPCAFTWDGVAATPTVPFFGSQGIYLSMDGQFSMSGITISAISGVARVTGAAIGTRVA